MRENVGCRRVRAGLTEYLEGALSLTRRQGVEKHLEACRDCQRDLASLRSVIAASRKLEGPEMPAPLRDRILGTLREKRE